ncbi:hypothetical protein ELI24_37375 [Rhizobium ruizarguesonis]|uniref:hypothetical protein n=1 Tax=Rhizobium ruizarguesonis TaxID=2081791 RepID=UPI0010314181|nr:hypothetical protein [Rhizobium ruizarguesonis]TAU17964.1 hypothetical protein ELI48_28875 [Rhizobium ruizarguesonis]TAU59831.1 hypothetical protein ELI45_30865 [Rhizobium ruizarguesonis]TAV02516.1 hypothetical protein ELI34_33060 [Rhizobium ruizarguesonis]TAV23432.1 hypothetical protein ELI35_29355 [Rhizobium ruizarguesonis]TAV84139.1 hypothetical protein ELI24_37375 [Rhizobium ruizarguesonis]
MTVVKGRTSPDEQKAYQDEAYRHGYTGSVAIPRVDLWIAAFLGLRRQDSAVGGVADPSSLGMSPVFAFLCSCALVVAALAANASRLGEGWAVPTFYCAIAVIFLPAAARIIHPRASRLERLALIVIVTSALFVVRVIRAPVAFIDHDEFLHWATVNDILEAGRLFLPNPLLPVSPLYPGLELITSALVNLSGLSVFAAGLIVLATARMMLMLALFLLFEKITDSARIASIACLIYMGSSTFLLFDVHYSYESLAIPMLAAVLLASESRRMEPSDAAGWPTVVATVVLILALAATHHLTSYFCTALLCGTAVMECLRQGASAMQKRRAILLASIAVIAPVAWSKIVGNPTGSYILPVLEGGIHEVAQLVSSSTSTRKLFVSDTGALAPAWQRYLTMAGVALICLGLLTGFLRSLVFNGQHRNASILWPPTRWRLWRSSLLQILVLVTLAYPVSIIFRLTRSGWEIGNRIGSLSFLGVAIVVAVAVAAFWHGTSRGWLRATALAAAATTVLIAGVISSEGPRILVPAGYEVSADSSSIEPMGISAARWTRRWLGGQHFAADRINRLLLSTYGRQRVSTTLESGQDTSMAITAADLGPMERKLLIDSGVGFVMVDLRMTTGLPGVGVYFDGGAQDRNHTVPLQSSSLLKFNSEPDVDRTFDNGFMVIFDVGRLGKARQPAVPGKRTGEPVQSLERTDGDLQ